MKGAEDFKVSKKRKGVPTKQNEFGGQGGGWDSPMEVLKAGEISEVPSPWSNLKD